MDLQKLTKVTDPNILAQLNATGASQGLTKVDDPEILKQLNSRQPASQAGELTQKAGAPLSQVAPAPQANQQYSFGDWAQSYGDVIKTLVTEGYESPQFKAADKRYREINKQVGEPVADKLSLTASLIGTAVFGYQAIKSLPETILAIRGYLSDRWPQLGANFTPEEMISRMKSGESIANELRNNPAVREAYLRDQMAASPVTQEAPRALMPPGGMPAPAPTAPAPGLPIATTVAQQAPPMPPQVPTEIISATDIQPQAQPEIIPPTAPTVTTVTPELTSAVTEPAGLTKVTDPAILEQLNAGTTEPEKASVQDVLEKARQYYPEEKAIKPKLGETVPEKETVGPTSLKSFIKSEGGVKPTDPLINDLKTSLGAAGGEKLEPGMVSYRGKSIDAMREAAVEVGLIPEDADINDFLKAIETEKAQPQEIAPIEKGAPGKFTVNEAGLSAGDQVIIDGKRYTVTANDSEGNRVLKSGTETKTVQAFSELEIENLIPKLPDREEFIKNEIQRLMAEGNSREEARKKARSAWRELWEYIKEINKSLGEGGYLDLEKLKQRIKAVAEMPTSEQVTPERKAAILQALMKQYDLAQANPPDRSILTATRYQKNVRLRRGKAQIKEVLTGKAIEKETGQRPVKVKEIIEVDKRKALVQDLKAMEKATQEAYKEGIQAGLEKSKAEPKLSIKRRILETATNIKKEQPTITEREALKRALQREQKAAKEAYRTAKKEVTGKYKLRQELAKIVREVNRAAKNASLPIDYKEQIRSKLEPYGGKLKPSSLADMTIDEIRTLGEQVKNIQAAGREAGKQATVKAKAARDKKIVEMIADMPGKKPYELPEGVPATEANIKKYTPGKVRQAIANYHRQGTTPEILIESTLDGRKKNGANYRYIAKPLLRGTENAENLEIDKVQKIIDKSKETKVDIYDLKNSKAKLLGNEFTREQIMGLYLYRNDKGAVDHIIQGNKLPEDIFAAAEKELTPAEKKFADWISKELLGENYSELNSIFRKLENDNLGQVEGYFPIRIDRRIATVPSGEEPGLFDELMGDLQFRRETAKFGALKARTGGKQPINLNAIDTLLTLMRNSSNYIGKAEAIHDVRSLLSSRRYKNALLARFGADMSRILNKTADDVAGKNMPESPFDRFMSTLQNKVAQSLIGFNAKSIMRQPISITAAAQEVGIRPILNGMTQMMTKPTETISFINSKSKLVRARGLGGAGEVTVRELIKKLDYASRKRIDLQVARIGMKGILYSDIQTVRSVWKGAYDMYIAEGKTDAEAVELADKLIRRTQPDARSIALSDLQRSGQLFKTLDIFRNQIGKDYQIFVNDIVGGLKHGEISPAEAARRSWWMFGVRALVLYAISEGLRLPKNKKEIAKTVLKYSPLSGMPVVGWMLDSIRDNIEYGREPSVLIVNPVTETVRAVNAITKGKWSKAAERAAKAAGGVAGVPVNPFIQLGKGGKKLAEGYSDPRILLWSEYTLEKQEPKTGFGRTRRPKRKGR